MRLIFLIVFFPLLLSAGVPEKPYFQQEVHYKIKVALNDKKHTLRATEEIEYINRSSDTLTFIWFHLWPNAYKDRNSALCKQQVATGKTSLYFAKDKDRGYIDSLNFTADGEQIKTEIDSEYNDICKLFLNKPLLPGQRTIIRTPFFVKIPSGRFSRMGHIGQAYSITQWYPKPAVYDLYGWHPIPYLDQGEFYSEFGSFDVSITLPRNYVVGATGNLPEGDHEYVWMSDIAGETETMKVFSTDMAFPESDTETKTLTFTQNNVHDFGWFADKRYHVLKGEVELPRTGKKVTTWALFTNNEAPLWMKSIDYMNNAISSYSKWNGDYAYNQCTIVDGTISAGGGMEYPNVAIIGSCGDAFSLDLTIAHEVGHNWFYGMLGSNEREHPWMDEGINSFYELRYINESYPVEKFGDKNELQGSFGGVGNLLGLNQMNYKQTFDLEYKVSATSNTDQPIEGPAPKFYYTNYGTIVYSKTGLVFNYLKSYLGDSLFDKCMQQYFTEWCFRHPYPADLEKIFRSNCSQNLDWFFNGMLDTNGKIDYGISKLKLTTEGYQFNLKQKGDLQGPVQVAGFHNGKSMFEEWILPSTKDTILTIPCKECDSVCVDPYANTIDIRREDNQIRTNGLFKKIEPLSLDLFAHFEYPTKTRIFWSPAIAWNDYNKFMAGIVVHNEFLPFRKIEFAVAPMYGFGDKSLAGVGEVNYHFYPRTGCFIDIIAGVNAKRFAYQEDEFLNRSGNQEKTDLHYNRVEPSLTFLLRPTDLRSTIRKKLKASVVLTNTQNVSYYSLNEYPIPDTAEIIQDNKAFYRLEYVINDSRAIDPWSTTFNFEGSNDFSKISTTLNYRFTYNKPKKGLDIRFFAGYMFTEVDPTKFYGFTLSDRSATSGSKDYAYDEMYFGRSEIQGVLFQQMALRQGAFKIYNPIGSDQKWIIVMNLKSDLPITLPIQLYADIGTYDNIKSDLNSIGINSSFSYDAGICLELIPQTIEIYFPLLKSKEIKEYIDQKDITYGEQIRFVFNLNKMNPLKFRDQFTR